jgi:hypothetical protein
MHLFGCLQAKKRSLKDRECAAFQLISLPRIDWHFHALSTRHRRSLFEASPRSGEGQKRGQNDGGMLRGFCALCDAPNWLAAESVHASRAAPSLSMGQAISMPPSIANKNRNEAGCEQARFLSGVDMGKEWAS